MTATGGLALVLFAVAVVLEACVWRLRRKADNATTEPTDDDRAAAQALLADSFTRLFEVAEGRRNAMLAAGWSESAAEMCAALMFASMVQATTGGATS